MNQVCICVQVDGYFKCVKSYMSIHCSMEVYGMNEVRVFVCGRRADVYTYHLRLEYEYAVES